MAENTNTEREAFESALTKLCAGFGEEIGESDLDRTPSGAYVNGSTEVAWMLWQARASLSLPAAGQEPVAWYFKSPKRPGEKPLIQKLDWRPHNQNWAPLYAAPQPAVAAGWMMVPKESTAAMQWAFARAETRYQDGAGRWHLMDHASAFKSQYAAMLAALPPAPSTEGESNG